MSSNIVYHEVIPTNLLTEYGEFQNVDFDISVPNRKINLGSMRIEGELEVKYGDNFLNATAQEDNTAVNVKQIKLDGLVGAHSFIESINCTISPNGQKNVVETLNEYPRYVKMAVSATSGRNDMMDSNHTCEMKASYDDITQAIMQGVVPPTMPSDALRLNPDFSIRPLFCMNSGQGAVSYRQVGDIQISITLARTFGAIYGNDVNSKVSYKIRDLKLRFTSRPDDGEDDPVVMKTKLNIKQSIQSSFANIQTRVPAVCNAVSVSFQPQGEENTAQNNNLQLAKVPNLSQTQYLFNDSTNTLVSYLIRSVSEVIDRGINSMVDTSRNSLSTQHLANNNGFLAGTDFGGQAVDLSDTKFSLQLQSSVSSASPLIAYMYFHSFVEV
jgi:hypothetical protein